MRLLTVPQFARRVRCSVEEVLALIASRDLKALRPDPEGGYRVLETEVDRLLQERTTRLKRFVAPEAASPPSRPDSGQAGVPRAVSLDRHLSVVTALEAAQQEQARWERRNLALQEELFSYRRALEEQTAVLVELRAQRETAQQRAATLEREAQGERAERERVAAEHAELAALNERLEADKAALQRPWWRRWLGR